MRALPSWPTTRHVPTARRRPCERVERRLKKLSAGASDFASHKPDCADLRKLFSPFKQCFAIFDAA